MTGYNDIFSRVYNERLGIECRSTKMARSFFALLCYLAVIALIEANVFDSQSDCDVDCIGDRDEGCVSKSIDGDSKFVCSCQASYFGDDDSCERECGALYWSWFTFGTCTKDVNGGVCAKTCGWRIRLWATIFVIVVFAAAVVILVFILPMCISSCKACLMIRKDEKRKKRAQYAAENYNYASSYVDEGARGTIMPATIGKYPAIQQQQQGYYYNPYAIYSTNTYGRMYNVPQ